jgi:hypothetical protein
MLLLRLILVRVSTATRVILRCESEPRFAVTIRILPSSHGHKNVTLEVFGCQTCEFPWHLPMPGGGSSPEISKACLPMRSRHSFESPFVGLGPVDATRIVYFKKGYEQGNQRSRGRFCATKSLAEPLRNFQSS